MKQNLETHQSTVLLETYKPHFDLPIEQLLDLVADIPRGAPDTIGATPLDQLATVAQQMELLNELIQYTYDVPEGVSLELADYVHQTFRDRFYNRVNANGENYAKALLQKNAYDYSPEITDVITRAETGHASAAELLIVRDLLGISSVELACLTHPYGEERIKLLDPMREVVAESVQRLGGEIVTNPDEQYRVKEIVLCNLPEEDRTLVYSMNNHERLAAAQTYGGVAGIFMTRKRTIATMPDGTIIKERSSLVVRVGDDSPVQSVDVCDALSLPNDAHWEEAAARLNGLEEVVAALMRDNIFAVAIPIASTIYAYNPSTKKLVDTISSVRTKAYKQPPQDETDGYFAPSTNLGHINLEHVIARAREMLEDDENYEVDDSAGMLVVKPRPKD